MLDENTLAKLFIPDGLDFKDLQLERDKDGGDLWFNVDPLAIFCKANNLDLDKLFDDDEEAVTDVLCRWYQLHLAQGGAIDMVTSGLFAEIMAGETYGEANVMHGQTQLQ
jgi:hypothetical protein